MVGIYGIGGIPEPANTTTAGASGKKETSPSIILRDSDGVVISARAQQTSKIAKMLETSEEQAKLQAERIAKARESIEQGTYKMQDVVRIVASRVSRFIPMDITTKA